MKGPGCLLGLAPGSTTIPRLPLQERGQWLREIAEDG